MMEVPIALVGALAVAESDIDIEEHDVMDNPAIKSMFPDLTIVKTEICDVVYDPPHEPSIKDTQEDRQPSASPVEVHNADSTTDSPAVLDPPPESPSIVTSSQHLSPSAEPSNNGVNYDEDSSSGDSVLKQTFEAKCYRAQILIEDSSKVLDDSKSFCDECKILFPTENSLAVHKMATHSHLVAVQREEKPNDPSLSTCHICSKAFTRPDNLMRHIAAAHKRRTSEMFASVKESPSVRTTSVHRCQTCNMAFHNQDELVKHVYQHIPKSYKCVFCAATFTQQTSLVTHLECHVPSKIKSMQQNSFSRYSASPSPSVSSQSNASAVTRKYQCKDDTSQSSRASTVQLKKLTADPYSECARCLLYFNRDHVFLLHMRLQHGMNWSVVPPQARVDSISTDCSKCQKDMHSELSYHKHVRTCHVGYQCTKCKKKFLGVNHYQIHMRSCVNFGNVKVKKATVLGSKVSKKSATNLKYTCLLCKAVYDTYNSAWKHKNKCHKGSGPMRSVISVTSKSARAGATKALAASKLAASAACKQPAAAAMKPGSSALQVKPTQMVSERRYWSLNTVFKCNLCDFHYTSLRSLHHHSEQCVGVTGRRRQKTVICPICDLKFAKLTMSSHQFQHTSGKPINVVRLEDYDEQPDRYLCRCCTCKIHIEDERVFRRHSQRNCHIIQPQSVVCTLCNIKISPSLQAKHEYAHSGLGITPEDFVIIDYDIVRSSAESDQNEHKRKGSELEQSEDEIVPAKKRCPPNALIKKAISVKSWLAEVDTMADSKESITLYFCKRCKNCFHNQTCHNRTCNGNRGFLCNICGLSFTRMSKITHQVIHAKSETPLTMDSFTLLHIVDKLRVRPQPYNFPRCEKCYLTFDSAKECESHKERGCAESLLPIVCDECETKLTPSAYRLHMMYHNYRKPRAAPTPSPNVEKQTLLEKYNQLSETWNVLFQCVSCEVAVDRYHRVIAHCESHLETDFDVASLKVFKCQICNLLLETDCYQRHARLHSTKLGLNLASFTIYQYNYKLYESPDWEQLVFKGLDSVRIEQLKKIALIDIPTVRLTLLQDGPEEQTIYKCKTCQVTLTHPVQVRIHAHFKCAKLKLFSCSRCKMLFISSAALAKHTDLHVNNPDWSESSCKLVQFSPAMKSESTKHQGEIPSNKKHYVYQCRSCKLVVANKANADRHQTEMLKDCSKKQISMRKCPQCNLLVGASIIRKHLRLHSVIPTFRRENIVVVPFGKAGVENEVAKTKPIVKYDDQPTPSQNINIKYVKEGLMTIKPQQDGLSEFMLYQCRKCRANFTNHKSLYSHIKVQCNVDECRRPLHTCAICGLLFYKLSLKFHLEHHALNPNLTARNVKIVNFGLEECNKRKRKLEKRIVSAKNKNTSQKESEWDEADDFIDSNHRSNTPLAASTDAKVKPAVKIFKCKCGLHFVNRLNAEKHLPLCQRRPRPVKETCNTCGLMFTHEGLFSHITMHHGANHYDLYDFEIVVVENTTDEPEEKPPELFRCGKCSIYYSNKCVAKHHFASCRGILKSEVNCSFCDLPFSCYVVAKHIQEAHEKRNYKRSDFKIFVLERNNAKCSVDFLLEGKDTPVPISITKPAIERVHQLRRIAAPPENENSIVMPKCKACDVHFLSDATARRHIFYNHTLIEPIAIKECSQCGITFRYRSHDLHKLDHNKAAGFNLENVIVCEYDPASKDSQNSPNKYGLERVTKPGEETVDTTANLEGNEDQKSLTLNNELPEIKYDNIDNKIYKCKECGVHFLKECTISRHAVYKHEKINPATLVNCKECGLAFRPYSLKIHNKIHHNIKKFQLKNFTIIEYAPVTKLSIVKLKKVTPEIVTLVEGEPVNGLEEDDKLTANDNPLNDTQLTDNLNISVQDMIEDIVDKELPTANMITTDQLSRSDEVPAETIDENINAINIQECDAPGEVSTPNLTKSNDCDELMIVDISENSNGTDTELHSKEDNATIKMMLHTKNNVNKSTDFETSVKEDEVYEIVTPDETENPSLLLERLEQPLKVLTKRPQNRLYRCKKCNIHFLTEFAIRKHISPVHKNIGRMSRSKCSKCRLKFLIHSLKIHLQVHHKQLNLQPKDFTIVELEPTLNNTVQEESATEISESEMVLENPNTSKSPRIKIKIKRPQSDKKSKSKPSPKGKSKDQTILNMYFKNIVTYRCDVCSKRYKTESARDAHHSTEHLDGEQPCGICAKSFPASVLNEKHLCVTDLTFTCCVCGEELPLLRLDSHAEVHTILEP